MLNVRLPISGSVGLNGSNAAKDVATIRALLNVYRRAQAIASLLMSTTGDDSLAGAIKAFQKDHLKLSTIDGRIDPNGKTHKALIRYLRGVKTSIAISAPSYGAITWHSEGAEGGPYHSRILHVPTSASGLTISRGYDMKKKSEAIICSDLIKASVSKVHAETIKSCSGLSGDQAKRFIVEKDLLDFSVSAAAQLSLFKTAYDYEAKEVKRICGKADVVEAYGTTDWGKLNSYIKDCLIDLKFRGDYRGSCRKFLQKHVADNDIVAFKAAMIKKDNWTSFKVPADRFKRRVDFIKKAPVPTVGKTTVKDKAA